MSFLCNLNINPLSDIWFANILSYSIGSFVILLFLSFFLLISLMWSHFCCFQLLWIILLVSHRKIIGKTNVEALFLYDLCYWNWKSFSIFLGSSLLVYRMHLIFVFLFHTQKIYWIFLLVICRVLVFSMFMIVSFFLPFLCIHILR